jgi:hypothetical protein
LEDETFNPSRNEKSGVMYSYYYRENAYKIFTYI